MNHTPEPWVIERPRKGLTSTLRKALGPDAIFIVSYESIGALGTNIAGLLYESWADARRIVACVNACAGISTEDLEKGMVTWTSISHAVSE